MISFRISQKDSHRYFHTLAALCCAIAIYGCRVTQRSQANSEAQKTAVSAVDSRAEEQQPLKCAGNPDCPATVSLVKTGPSKPPLTFYQFEIRLLNRQPTPSWLVLRYSDALASTGKFECYPEEKHCISATQLAEGEGEHQPKTVVIHFLGRQTFTAIRIPEGGDISLSEYVMNTAEPVPEFEVWEVDSILVNGKTPLQQWLPYPVMSDRLVHIKERPKKTLIDWDVTRNTYRQDYPTEKVEFMAVHPIRKWLVPILPRERTTQ
jgi:hypothetical protein